MLRRAPLVLMLLSASLAYAQQRAPLPAEDAVKETKKLVAEVYRDDYTKAKTPEQKLRYVDKLLADATKSNDDLTGKYVLLLIARDIAASIGDWESTAKACEQLSQQFEIDLYDQLNEVRSKVDQIDKTPRDPRAAYTCLMSLIDGAIAKDRYDVAEQLTLSAKKVAKKVSDVQVAKQLADRIPDLQKLRRQHDAVKSALTQLEKTPADPAANLAIGKFRCFAQGRWEEGVAMLALGSDMELAKIAKQELNQPGSPAELLAIGDAWWDLAAKDRENERALRLHAIDRYLRVHPRLEGLPRKKVEARFADSEQWLSKDATYILSHPADSVAPLPSLLNTSEKFYGDPPNNLFAFDIAKKDAFIVIDLKREVPISRIHIMNRPVRDRTRGSGVFLSTSPDRRGDQVWTAPDNAAEWNIMLPRLYTARYVTIARDPVANPGDAYLALRKVKIFGP